MYLLQCWISFDEIVVLFTFTVCLYYDKTPTASNIF